jgi:RNA polymerase sigma factor (sigma-70 family)
VKKDDQAPESDARHARVAFTYERHATKLRKIVRAKVVSSVPPDARGRSVDEACLVAQDVDDLVHEVFARLLAATTVELASDRDPVPYLVTMARNIHLDRVRRQRRQAANLFLAPSEMRQASEQRIESALEDGSDVQRRVQLEIIAAYVASLPEELFVAYEARFTRGLSQQDTARLLGVSRRHVRTLEARLLAGALQALESLEPNARARRCVGSGASLRATLGVENGGPSRVPRRISE